MAAVTHSESRYGGGGKVILLAAGLSLIAHLGLYR